MLTLKFLAGLLLFTAVFSSDAEQKASSAVRLRPLLCLATNIYFEAGNQTYKGKLAVKDVTLNRGGYICDTVFKRKQFSWTHQREWSIALSFLLDEPKLNKLEAKAWEESKKAASDLTTVLPRDYTHYHHIDVTPYWSKAGIVIGNHKFLKGVK